MDSGGRQALITGASSGIGAATAKVLAQAGFAVILTARSESKLQSLVQTIRQQGNQAEWLTIDLSAVDQIKTRVKTAIETLGSIDVLVNCAGMGYTGQIGDMPLTDWQQILDLNVTSVFQMIQAVLPDMRSRQSGTIVNIASIAAQQSFPNWGAYGVSKAALVALSNALAVEESGNGIRVITISPGAVNTGLWDTATVQADFERSQMIEADTIAQTILHTVSVPTGAVISNLTITPSQGAL